MAKKKKSIKKVRCATCKSYYNKFCVLKRVTVSPNKKRICDKYRHDQSKVKLIQPLPTTRISYREKERLRKERKENLKKLKEQLKLQEKHKEQTQESRIYKPSGDEKYPLTGDLSRFTTTGTSKDKDEKDS
jgi:hypothetical protein